MSGKDKKQDLYAVLEVAKTATPDQIRSSYRTLALKYHPDKNPGNKVAEEKFKAISHAYEIISDPEKRKIYDQYGEEAVNQGGGFHSAQDIFSSFFDVFGGNGDDGDSPFGGFGGMFGGGRRGGNDGPKRTRDVVFQLQVPLKEFYTGRERKLKVNKQVICDICAGTGAKSGSAGEVTCSDCRGRGAVMEVNQIRPGFISQTQRHCDRCKGKGKIIAKENQCKKCKGNKVVEEPKVITVNVTRGMDEGEKIVFYGESDQTPGASPGDLVVVLVNKDEETEWSRKGDDLVYRKTIPLADALTGYTFDLTHLDGRVLRVSGDLGDVVKPQDVRLIDNEGMPKIKTPGEKGKLYVLFDIEFPDWSDIRENAKEIRKMLTTSDNRMKEDGDEKRKDESSSGSSVIEEVKAKIFRDGDGSGSKKRRRSNEKKKKTKQSDTMEDSDPEMVENGQRQEQGNRCHQQ